MSQRPPWRRRRPTRRRAPAPWRVRAAGPLGGSVLRAALLMAILAGLAGSAGPAAAQAFGRNKVQYDAFDWHVLRTEHFDVYYYPEARELAEIGAQFAEEAYAELEHRFEFSLVERVPLVFYATNLHFKQTNIIPSFIPDGVGGFFEFMKGRVVIPADGNLHRFRRVVRHELVHVMTFNKLARVLRDHRRPTEVVLPLWFTEGLAEYWSGPRDYNHEMILRDAVASGSFVPLENLGRIAGTFTMYKIGEAFCHFVAETYGEEKVGALIDDAWRDNNFERVIEFSLGEPLRVVSDRFTAYVEARYRPGLVGADVPSLVAPAVAARGFSFKPVVHALPDGRREVVYFGNTSGYTNLYAQPVDGALRPVGRPEVLIRGERSEDFESFHAFESRMDVTPGGLLAFVSKRGARDVVHLYDLRARRRAGLYGFDELVAVYSPTLSPDGRRIAFTGVGPGGFADLYLFDRDAGRLRQLTRDPYDDRDPHFHPSGEGLLFSSSRGAHGPEGAYNLFTYDLGTDAIGLVTTGPFVDLSPRWHPDGRRFAFTSNRAGPGEAPGVQNLHVGQTDAWRRDTPPALAQAAPAGFAAVAAATPGRVAADPPPRDPSGSTVQRATDLTGAAFDPYWAGTDTLLFASFEDYRFTVRAMPLGEGARLRGAPQAALRPEHTGHLAGPAWAYARYAPADADAPERRSPYRRRYALDAAQGAVTTAPALGYSGGGAALAFSDMLGDDRILVSAFSTNAFGRNFLDGLNVSVTRVHLGRRANYGYGAYRLSGPRFDRADPDGPAGLPTYERVVGGLGLVSYPLSQFQRVDLQTSAGWSQKEVLLRATPNSPRALDTLETALVSNALSLVHDNALYSIYGPADGWRANLTAAYTTDVLNSNVSYYTLSADARRYWRLSRDVTFAQWGLVRANVGRRARYNLLGGSWSLRGFPLLRVRSEKLWFVSNELRFPIVRAPGLVSPLLAPIAGVRGALFADVARPWNSGYAEREEDVYRDNDTGRPLVVGTTLGSLGGGLRVNLLGAFVLRYDVGYKFLDGLDWDERVPFRQFFFGWDF